MSSEERINNLEELVKQLSTCNILLEQKVTTLERQCLNYEERIKSMEDSFAKFFLVGQRTAMESRKSLKSRRKEYAESLKDNQPKKNTSSDSIVRARMGSTERILLRKDMLPSDSEQRGLTVTEISEEYSEDTGNSGGSHTEEDSSEEGVEEKKRGKSESEEEEEKRRKKKKKMEIEEKRRSRSGKKEHLYSRATSGSGSTEDSVLKFFEKMKNREKKTGKSFKKDEELDSTDFPSSLGGPQSPKQHHSRLSLGGHKSKRQHNLISKSFKGTQTTCSFLYTSKEGHVQKWYNCEDCGILGDLGICVSCAKLCHRGHKMSAPNTSRIACACGSKGVLYCRCLSHSTSDEKILMKPEKEKQREQAMAELLEKVNELWSVPLAKCSLGADITRLGSKHVVFGKNGSQVSPESVFTDRSLATITPGLRYTVSALGSTNKTNFETIKELFLVLSEQMGKREVHEKNFNGHFSPFLDEKTAQTTDLSRVFNEYILLLGEDDSLVRLLKASCNQAIVSPAWMNIKMNILKEFPFKDMKHGWKVYVVFLEEEILVIHRKKEQGINKETQQEDFSFVWELKLAFSLNMEKLKSAVYGITELNFSPEMETIKSGTLCSIIKVWRVPPFLPFSLDNTVQRTLLRPSSATALTKGANKSLSSFSTPEEKGALTERSRKSSINGQATTQGTRHSTVQDSSGTGNAAGSSGITVTITGSVIETPTGIPIPANTSGSKIPNLNFTSLQTTNSKEITKGKREKESARRSGKLSTVIREKDF